MQTNIPLVSIVVPVYNTAKYVAECVESILSQTFADYEAILVDDGSTDDSPTLLDSLATRDPRLRVVHQPNGGVTAARRKGVEEALGQWIYFIDADDRPTPDGLDALVQRARQDSEVDIVEGCATTFDDEKLLAPTPALCRTTHAEVAHPDAISFVKGIYTDGTLSEASGSVWGKLIRREKILETNALDIPRRFTNGEDILMLMLLSRRLRKHVMVEKDVYLYRVNLAQSASSNRLTATYWCDWLEFAWTNVFSSRLSHWQEPWEDICREVFHRLAHTGLVRRSTDLTPFFYLNVLPYLTASKGKIHSSTDRRYLAALSKQPPLQTFLLKLLDILFYLKNHH